jgi:transposase InsO family protein
VRDESPYGSTAPPAAFYLYSPDRKDERAHALLKGCRGHLHAEARVGASRPGAGAEETICWQGMVELLAGEPAPVRKRPMAASAVNATVTQLCRHRRGLRICRGHFDAWSRGAVGYAISRSIDARLTLAALNAAIERRKPPAGCVHHSDRGSQYAARAYREVLLRCGLVGSMGRRGNPSDNAKAESFMKTLKVEAVYPMAYETFADVADDLPRLSTRSTTDVVSIPPWAISPPNSSRIATPDPRSNQRPDLRPPQRAHSGLAFQNCPLDGDEFERQP